MRPVSKGFLKRRAEASIAQGFKKQKWIEFCELLLEKNLSVHIYEARTTKSKYIYVKRKGKEVKIRFSDHKPNRHKELTNDCDFFVGRTNTGVRTTEDAKIFVFLNLFSAEELL